MSQPDPHRLGYAVAPWPGGSPMRVFPVVVLAALLTLGHLWYTHDVAWRLEELSGGSQSRMTLFGSRGWAWTVPAHVPGGMAFYMGIETRGLSRYRGDPAPFGLIGILLVFLGSIAAAIALASLVVRVLYRDQPVMGRYWWRLWCVLLGWGWIPVPAAMSWIFQWTVVY